jgi:hypothetical protein
MSTGEEHERIFAGVNLTVLLEFDEINITLANV